MRRILVTGANKGIGLAIVEAILREHDDAFVFLGSRDRARGDAARATIVGGLPAVAEKIETVTLDVSDPASIDAAAKHVATRLGEERLYGLVNNAGIGNDGADLARVLATNTLGVQRTCEAFLSLLEPDGGRIVNVTSASGPIFVASCTPDRQAFFLDGAMTWPRLHDFVDASIATGGDHAALAALGLGTNAYGLSKACANAYTAILAREHPRLVVNACTPGYIATDMTAKNLDARAAAAAGMKTPAEGARAPMHLLFGALTGNGHYYGSDARRSPLDRYRAPGSPEHTGD